MRLFFPARVKLKENPLVAKIDAALPQTQCRRCGFPGCEPYARAVAEGQAEINQCSPGGEEGVRQLAELLGVSPIPLNPAYGAPKPQAVALINEQLCIGCTLCIQACPVDAIVGAVRHMHTVIAADCTGCELCIKPCPVDCISMVPPGDQVRHPADKSCVTTDNCAGYENEKAGAGRARARYQRRLQRLEREKQECEKRSMRKAKTVAAVNVSSAAANLKKITIQAALERASAAQANASRKRNDTDPRQTLLNPDP